MTPDYQQIRIKTRTQDPRPTCVGIVDHLPELGEEGGHVAAGGAELGGQRDLYHRQHLDLVTTVHCSMV